MSALQVFKALSGLVQRYFIGLTAGLDFVVEPFTFQSVFGWEALPLSRLRELVGRHAGNGPHCFANDFAVLLTLHIRAFARYSRRLIEPSGWRRVYHCCADTWLVGVRDLLAVNAFVCRWSSSVRAAGHS